MLKKMIINAVKIIKKGKVYDLGMEINKNIPDRGEGIVPFNLLFEITPEDSKKSLKKINKNSKVSFSSEVIIGATHTSTHIDALCHWQLNDKIHAEFNANDVREENGWKKYGVETIPPIIGRGILLDIAKYLKADKLKDSYIISLEIIKSYLKKNNLTINPADIICLRTGKIKDFYNENYFKECPGYSKEATNWLCKQGISILGSDCSSVDPLPLKNFNNSNHINILYRNGIYIIEALYLEELSKDEVSEFFMICSAPKFTGCSGAWIRPVGIT